MCYKYYDIMALNLKARIVSFLRFTEKYTKTDMVYLAKGGLWMNLGFITINAFAFILSIAFAKFLTKEVYGTYQFILSIGSILSALTLTGMNNAIIQAVARGYEGAVRSSISVQLRYNLTSLCVAFIIFLYYLLNGDKTIALGVLLIGFLTPVFSAFNTYLALISGRKDFKGGYLYNLYLIIPYNIAMLACIIFVRDPIALVATNFGANTISSIIIYYIVLKRYKPNHEEDSSTIAYGKHLSIAGIITTIAAQADNILAFHYLGNAQLAVYAFAKTIPERIGGTLKGITIMAFPKLSEKSPEELKKGVLSRSLRLAALTLVISLFYISVAPFLYKILFPEYIDSILYSQGFSLMLVLATLSSFPLTSLMAMKAQREIYAHNIVSSVIGIALMATLTAFHGIWGIIIAKGLSGLINYAISLAFVARAKRSSLQ
jgi:O-antigen/teichoic acid export membrane protein